MNSRRRTGFTLVELLVVITIIGILMGLLLPAVSMVRESARRSQCGNRIRQLALAVNTFHESKERYPGWREWTARVNIPVGKTGPVGANKPASWMTMLLPYMDHEPTSKYWENPKRVFSAQLSPAIPSFLCPSDRTLEGTQLLDAAPETSYVANAGCGRTLNNRKLLKANGVFQDLVYFDGKTLQRPTVHLRLIELADGATHTITVSETLQAEFWHQSTPNLYQARTVKEYDQILKNRTHRACYSNIMVWWPKPPAGSRLGILNAKLCQLNGQATNDILRDRSPRAFMPYAARPSSNHKGGVTVGFADGHTAFISDGIDYIAYQSLLTPDNAKSSMPNPGYQLSTSDLGN